MKSMRAFGAMDQASRGDNLELDLFRIPPASTVQRAKVALKGAHHAEECTNPGLHSRLGHHTR